MTMHSLFEDRLWSDQMASHACIVKKRRGAPHKRMGRILHLLAVGVLAALCLGACGPDSGWLPRRIPPVAADRFAPSPVEFVCDHTIDATVALADGRENYAAVKPGDTICIEAGARASLKLRNFQGERHQRIRFINAGGVVVVRGNLDEHAGIDIRNSEHIWLTGTGERARCGAAYRAAEQRCGFVIMGGMRGIAGIDKTGYIEIDHVEVRGPAKMGITVKSNDRYGVNRAVWTQHNTYLHHNYVHDTGTEGFYLGSSYYDAGDDPVLEGVEVSHNLIAHGLGWSASGLCQQKLHHSSQLHCACQPGQQCQPAQRHHEQSG